MTKALTEADGPSWREKLPPIPTVPLSVRQKLAQQATPIPPGAAAAEAARPAPGEADVRKGQTLKEEGNALVRKGEHRKAIEKYSQSLKHNPAEATTYTNRWASAPVCSRPGPAAPLSTRVCVCVCAGLCVT